MQKGRERERDTGGKRRSKGANAGCLAREIGQRAAEAATDDTRESKRGRRPRGGIAPPQPFSIVPKPSDTRGQCTGTQQCRARSAARRSPASVKGAAGKDNAEAQRPHCSPAITSAHVRLRKTPRRDGTNRLGARAAAPLRAKVQGRRRAQETNKAEAVLFFFPRA